MAQITLTSGATPAFLSKNYINRDCYNASAVAVSSGDTIKRRLYDGDPTGPWNSVGSSDETTETITIGLYQGNLLATRSIDFIALLNINLKGFVLEYSANDGASYTAFTGGTQTVHASEDFIISLASPVSANKIRLTMTTTQTANAEKSIGQFVAALGTLQMAKGFTSYEAEWIEAEMASEMANRTKQYAYIYSADNSFEMYAASAGFRFVPAAERTSLRDIKNTAAPFLFYPFPGDQVRTLSLGKFRQGSFKDPFSTEYIGAGYDISFEFEGVGGS